VQRGEHEVARLGQRERDGDALGVAHLAHEDDVGVLTQRGPQAAAKLGVSLPTSRWLTAALLWLCTYSMGSSMVRMWHSRNELMRSTMAASVVDLPEPVGPAASTSPYGRRIRSSMPSGVPISSSCGMRVGMARSASAVLPFVR
jgi:hypothetical protein